MVPHSYHIYRVSTKMQGFPNLIFIWIYHFITVDIIVLIRAISILTIFNVVVIYIM